MKPRSIKVFYTNFHDQIGDKRINSPYKTRAYAHRATHMSVARYVQPGQTVLDVGCGEGHLTLLMASRGATCVGVDISKANISAAKQNAVESGFGNAVNFVLGDAEDLPFSDSSFDIVVSSHVLEHLPDLRRGLEEIRRVTKSRAVIALPTCLNPAAWIILGGGSYWRLSVGSLVKSFIGMLRVGGSLVIGADGVDEGYSGFSVPHVWRFPWVMRKELRDAGFDILDFRANTVLVPYMLDLWPMFSVVQDKLDQWSGTLLLRNFGYGSVALVQKR